MCTFGGENETYLRGVEERGRGQRVPPSTIRRPGVAFIHFTRVCYPRTSTIPMHPLGPASGVPIYRLRQKIYDRTPSTRPFPLSSFYPSCIYCYHFLPERGRDELEERRRLRLSTTIIPIVLRMAVEMVEKRRRKMEASKSRVEVGFDRGWTSRAQQCGETDR